MSDILTQFLGTRKHDVKANFKKGMSQNMAQTKIDPGLFTKLDEYIAALPTKQGALIAVLHHAQEIVGYLPVEVQDHIAQKLDIPASKVMELLRFIRSSP